MTLYRHFLGGSSYGLRRNGVLWRGSDCCGCDVYEPRCASPRLAIPAGWIDNFDNDPTGNRWQLDGGCSWYTIPAGGNKVLIFGAAVDQAGGFDFANAGSSAVLNYSWADDDVYGAVRYRFTMLVEGRWIPGAPGSPFVPDHGVTAAGLGDFPPAYAQVFIGDNPNRSDLHAATEILIAHYDDGSTPCVVSAYKFDGTGRVLLGSQTYATGTVLFDIEVRKRMFDQGDTTEIRVVANGLTVVADHDRDAATGGFDRDWPEHEWYNCQQSKWGTFNTGTLLTPKFPMWSLDGVQIGFAYS